MKKLKKGFTIVELVIVIAVIGVLSAILIPTFVNLTSKAQDSADKSLVTNLNTSLKIAEVGEDSKPKTMSGMLATLNKQGYQLDQLVTKTDADLLYNLEENEFFLSTDEKVVSDAKKYNYWKIYEELPDYDDQVYSIYLNNVSLDTEVRVQVGIDLGENNSIPMVTYERGSSGTRKVVVRTNTGDLTIDAPNDTVYHYGTSVDVTIDHISSSSYFAFADTSFVSIASGRIVVEPDVEIDGLFIKDNGVTVAKATGATLPKISRGEEVTSVKVQTTSTDGQKDRESTITISGTETSATGDVPSSILASVESELSSPIEEKYSRLAAKYDCRIGDHVDDDESNYYVSLQDAIDTFSTSATAVKIHLIRDVVVTSSLLVNDTNATKLAHYLYLEGFSIIGNGCTPITCQSLKNTFTISGAGRLIGDETHPCLITSAGSQITVLSVDTVGGFENNAATPYIALYNGNHTSCSFAEGGNYRLDTPSENSLYDCDISSLVNPFRNVVIDNGDGTFTLRRVTTAEQTANGWNKIAYNSDTYSLSTYERYDTIAHYLEYSDYASLTMKLLANVDEDVDSSITKSLTINANKKTFSGQLITKGSLTFSATKSAAGTFNISKIGCTTLTVGSYVTVKIDDGGPTSTAKTTLTIKGNSTTVTINGGTFSKAIGIYTTYTNTLIINGGLFKGNLTPSDKTGTKFSVSVRGGTYNTQAIYKTFSPYIAEGYEGGKDAGKTTYSVKPTAS